MSARRFTVDECPDAYGFATVRVFDGTPNGDTDQAPVATFYNREDAELFVGAVNAHVEWSRLVAEDMRRALAEHHANLEP